MKFLTTTFPFFLALVFCHGVTDASLLYIDAGPASSSSTWATGDYTTGSEFTVSTPGGIQVDQLGYIDGLGDGLVISHLVGLWRVSDQALLATALVTPGSDTQLSAQGTAMWYLEDIGSTLTLGPGTYRVAGFTGNGDSETLSNDKIGNGVTISSGYVRTPFPGGGFNYPNQTWATNGIRTTVGFSGANVPEPTSLAIVAGFGVVVVTRRRRQ